MSGRAKRLSLDRYLWLATRGLPRRARLDTAAVRVHLLERIRALEGQGFPRAEAEHVAVSEMGLPEGTNRAFLGHLFTYRVGWVVLGLAALSAAVWWGKDNLFAKEAVISSIPLGTAELSSILSKEMRNMSSYQAFKLVLPKGAVGLEWSIYKDGITGIPLFTELPMAHQKTLDGKSLPSNYRHELSVVLGFDPKSKTCKGWPGFNGIVNSDNFITGVTSTGLNATCYQPKDSYGVFAAYSLLTKEGLTLNSWTTLWVATMSANLSDCYRLDPTLNRADCSKRKALNSALENNPSHHWDRYAVVTVRPVDETHRLKTCVQQGYLSPLSSSTVGTFGVFGLNPPQPCPK